MRYKEVITNHVKLEIIINKQSIVHAYKRMNRHHIVMIIRLKNAMSLEYYSFEYLKNYSDRV